MVKVINLLLGLSIDLRKKIITLTQSRQYYFNSDMIFMVIIISHLSV